MACAYIVGDMGEPPTSPSVSVRMKAGLMHDTDWCNALRRRLQRDYRAWLVVAHGIARFQEDRMRGSTRGSERARASSVAMLMPARPCQLVASCAGLPGNVPMLKLL